MKICFLGGGNCHAITVARHFAARGHDCLGIGRSHPKPAALWLTPPGYRYYKAHLDLDFDLEVAPLLARERPDIVVCFAAQGESAASFGPESWRFHKTNTAMLARLVDEMVFSHELQPPKLFVQVSTSELYGSTETYFATEESPVRPTSPYALSKATFDAHLQMMYKAHNFPAVIVRPSNCYTPGQQLHRVVPRAVIAASYGKRMPLRGGSAMKTYMDTADLATAIECVIERGRAGEIYNVGADAPMTIEMIVEEIAQNAGVKLSDFVDRQEPRYGEDSRYAIDSSKIKALGWKRAVLLEHGIEAMFRWARDYPELATYHPETEMEVRP